MTKNKILVLGTGNAQADFIEFCKLSGLEVHSCSYKPEGRGISISDKFVVINITNPVKVIEYVKNNYINFIYSVGSDIAMPTLTYVSKKLNLPVFVPHETAVICNNKTLLRKVLQDISLYSFAFMPIFQESDLFDWSIFPAIIKPADSQGQRGVIKVANKGEIMNAYKDAIVHSRSHTAIIEEYIEGLEVSVNLYVLEGDIVLKFVTERISFNEYPGGIIKSHLYPVSHKINLDKINDLCLSAIRILNINNGPVYFQVKIDETGQPKIIEIAPRFDGCHIWRLVKEVKGINLFDISLKHLLGKKLQKNIFDQYETDLIPKAELTFFTSPPNLPFVPQNYNPSKESVYTEWYYEDGEIVRPINQYAEKVGYQILLKQ